MRILLLLLLVSCLSYVQADLRSRYVTAPPSKAAGTRPDSTRRAERIQATETTSSGELLNISVGCVRPGEILNFSGKNLLALSNPLLALKVENELLTLKQLNISNTQIISQLSKDKRIQANKNYYIHLKNSDISNSYIKTKLSIRICPFIDNNLHKPTFSSFEKGEILILADEILAKTIKNEALKLNYTILRNHSLVGLDKIMLVLGTEDQAIDDVINNLKKQFPDAVIDLNNHYQPSAGPRVYASKQITWPDIKNCKANDYQNLAIGIIDGYIDKTHPALTNQNITVKDFLNKNDQADKQHGTSIAVILAGDKPDSGFQGLLPGIQIMAAAALRQAKDNLIATTESIVRSLDWLVIKNVRLVNVSLSGTRANLILKSAFELGIKKGLIIFAAAGNSGEDAENSYPAALPKVIAVTAVDANMRLYTHANQGKYIDFSAPGVDIWTIDKGIKGKYRSGTSFASPHALAVAALYLGQNPSLSLDVLFAVMQANVSDLGLLGHDSKFGWGLIQTPQTLCQAATP